MRISGSRNFPVNGTTAVARVEINPGGLREMHWQPQPRRMAILHRRAGTHGRVRGFRPGAHFRFPGWRRRLCTLRATGHYIENTGTTPLRFLEIFKSSYCADLSPDTWLALTPPELLQAHVKLDRQVVDALRMNKTPAVGDVENRR